MVDHTSRIPPELDEQPAEPGAVTTAADEVFARRAELFRVLAQVRVEDAELLARLADA
jgi:hypothetical protein